MLLRADNSSPPSLVGYVVPSSDSRFDAREIVRSLRSSLPAHMVPTVLIELERLPLTPNGKVDRGALAAPMEFTAGVADDDSPNDALEWMLVDIWQRVLGRKHINIHDDFFELGGYSPSSRRLTDRSLRGRGQASSSRRIRRVPGRPRPP